MAARSIPEHLDMIAILCVRDESPEDSSTFTHRKFRELATKEEPREPTYERQEDGFTCRVSKLDELRYWIVGSHRSRISDMRSWSSCIPAPRRPMSPCDM